MKNYRQPGDVLTFTAPTGDVTAGNAYMIGGRVIVATVTALATVLFEGLTEGVCNLTKATGFALVEGQAVFWDQTNNRVTNDPAVGFYVGSVAQAGGAASGDTTVAVALPETQQGGGKIYSIRRRCTVAEVNAGVQLLPAIAGYKYRMIGCKAIAVGGAAGAVTTVDVTATQATATVKLVAYAQASLTQSTVLTAGGSGGAVLADGASFVANDAGTAINVGKTGSSVTTATNIDIIFDYALES